MFNDYSAQACVISPNFSQLGFRIAYGLYICKYNKLFSTHLVTL